MNVEKCPKAPELVREEMHDYLKKNTRTVFKKNIRTVLKKNTRTVLNKDCICASGQRW